MLPAALLPLVPLVLHLRPTAAAYAPLREYSGSTFFDKWDFTDDIDDKTWGNVTFLGAANANASKLVDVNAAGNAIIRVDNATAIAPAVLVSRNSVRIASQDAYPLGSVIVADMVHMPYGCSVWPSFWLLGEEGDWPSAGEIDIVEGINMATNNQMSLHTTQGCTQPAGVVQGGKTLVADCLTVSGTTHNGCITEERKENNYGAGFAAAQGGVYAVQLDVSGIYMWFWSRPNIPASITGATSTSSIDLADWGTPSAAYPAASCNITQFFQPQKMIFDITLCGLWAGVSNLYADTCPGECIADNIIGPGSPKYDTAYFEIAYIRTYGVPGTSAPDSSSNSSTNTTSTAGSSTAGNSTAGNSTAGGDPKSGSSGALGISARGGVLSLAVVGISFLLGF